MSAVCYGLAGRGSGSSKGQKKSKSGGRKCCKKRNGMQNDGTIYQWKNDSWRIKKKTIRTKKEFKKFQTVLKKSRKKASEKC